MLYYIIDFILLSLLPSVESFKDLSSPLPPSQASKRGHHPYEKHFEPQRGVKD